MNKTMLLKTKELLNRTINEFEKYFCIKIKKPEVIFYQTRSEIDSYHGCKTPAWLVGWVDKGNIHILAYDKFLKESSHTDKEDFWRTFKHELAHLYYKEKVKSVYPRWLNEGLACYLAGQKKTIKDLSKFSNVEIYYGKNDPRIYTIGYLMVNEIVSSFKINFFLSFLDHWANKKKTQANFRKLFIGSFGISPEELWKKIIKEIKNQVV